MTADFHAMLASLKAGEAPDTIYDDLSSVYEESLQGFNSAQAEHATALEGANGRIQELESQLSETKALKFDELMNKPAGNDGDGFSDTDGDGDDDDPASGGIDDLFDH